MTSEIPEWTQDEFDEFDRLTRMLSSLRQMDRITARIDIRNFEAKHGKAKCQAMFDAIRQQATP